MFLKYLDDWEKSVEQRNGFSKDEKKVMVISLATRVGLRITGKDNEYCTMVHIAYIQLLQCIPLLN